MQSGFMVRDYPDFFRHGCNLCKDNIEDSICQEYHDKLSDFVEIKSERLLKNPAGRKNEYGYILTFKQKVGTIEDGTIPEKISEIIGRLATEIAEVNYWRTLPSTIKNWSLDHIPSIEFTVDQCGDNIRMLFSPSNTYFFEEHKIA